MMMRKLLIAVGGCVLFIKWLFSHDIATHMYIASKTFEIFQTFDPEFYQFLNDTTLLGMFTRKFYYIGTTLPDMFDPHAQRGIRELLKTLRQNRGGDVWGLIGPLQMQLFIMMVNIILFIQRIIKFIIHLPLMV
jgi:hypothetical protein